MPGLLHDSNWSEMLEPLKGKLVGFIEQHGNVGDAMHREGAKQLLTRAGIEWYVEDFSQKNVRADELVHSGGGTLGKVWGVPANPGNGTRTIKWKKAYRVRRLCLESGKPLTFFPQSFSAKEVINCKALWVREPYSLNFHPDAKLAPDTGLAYEPENTELFDPHLEPGIFLKSKCVEGIVRHSRDLGDPIERVKTVEGYVALASRYKEIVTDRCHFAIAALIANKITGHHRRVVLLPNSYHKNLGLWEYSLKGFGCRFWNLAELYEHCGR